MSSVLMFRQPYKAKSETSPSCQRLPRVVPNVAALLSQVQALDLISVGLSSFLNSRIAASD